MDNSTLDDEARKRDTANWAALMHSNPYLDRVRREAKFARRPAKLIELVRSKLVELFQYDRGHLAEDELLIGQPTIAEAHAYGSHEEERKLF
jgi:hypothetical protein